MANHLTLEECKRRPSGLKTEVETEITTGEWNGINSTVKRHRDVDSLDDLNQVDLKREKCDHEQSQEFEGDKEQIERKKKEEEELERLKQQVVKFEREGKEMERLTKQRLDLKREKCDQEQLQEIEGDQEQIERKKIEDEEEIERLKQELEEIQRKNKEIERMKQQLQEIQRKNKEIERLDQESERLNQEIERKDQEIERKDQEIEREYQEWEEIKRTYLIAGLWENEDKLQFTLEFGGGTPWPTLWDSYAYPKRLSASTVGTEFSLLSPTLNRRTLTSSSRLLVSFHPNAHGSRRNSYGGKADVQVYVHNALADAAMISEGLLDEKDLCLHCGHESGIFSNKPDHLVVSVTSWKNLNFNIPILHVETKLPVEEIDNGVWGEIYDYHGFMRVLGHRNPFVVLSTFDESWITWDMGNKECASLAANTDVEARFNQTIQQFKKHFSHFSPHQELSETPAVPCNLEEQGGKDHSHATASHQQDQTMRQLQRSQAFPSNQLVKLFLNAIFCSLCNFPVTPIVRNDQGYQLTDKPVLTLEPNSYTYETISVKVDPGEFKYSNFAKEQKFHVLDLLRSGRTSKAFLAITTKGHECVLKMYVRKHDESENYMPIDKKQFDRAALRSTQTEQQMYKLLYGMDIPIITLFHHKCLVLPYLRPVQQDEQDSAIGELETLLRNKFRVTKRNRGTTYYMFDEYDQRWCHCGYMVVNGEKSLVAYDLAELEKCNNEREHNKYIEMHKERLRPRISSPISSPSSD